MKNITEKSGLPALQDTRSDVQVWRSLVCSMWMSNHLAGWSSAMNCNVSAVGSGRKPSGINVTSKRLWNPWGFGAKSVSITSGWPSSLVSKGYEFAASCACPGSSHHTDRYTRIAWNEGRRHPILWHTHQGCRASTGKTPDSASPPWLAKVAQRCQLAASSLRWPMLCAFFCQAGDVILSPSQSNFVKHTFRTRCLLLADRLVF